jgi:general stress protein 26
MTERSAIMDVCRNLMRESEVVVLTSLDDEGAPCARAVFNLRRETQFPGLRGVFSGEGDGLLVYVSTNTSSEKVRQVRRDPRVALYYCVPGTIHGVMLSGPAVVVADAAVKDRIWQPGWEMYYPEGRHDPDYAIVQLRVTRARGWFGGGPFDLRLEEHE